MPIFLWPGAALAWRRERHPGRAHGLANRAAIARDSSCPVGRRTRRGGADWNFSRRSGRPGIGSLEALHSVSLEDEDNLPGIIVVGAVAALAAIIASQDGERETARTSASLG